LEASGIDVDAVKEEAETLMRNNEFDGVDDLSIPEGIKEVFVTTQDLSSEQHGLMQRAFQEFCDSGISKTVNLPNGATHYDVSNAYRLALDADKRGAVIKGLTVYRDGSRNEQVLTTRVDNKLDDEDKSNLCPDCGEAEIEDTEDCAVCPECFYSPCK
jgi:ribonucleoside-diphosphate reductase alpha chain